MISMRDGLTGDDVTHDASRDGRRRRRGRRGVDAQGKGERSLVTRRVADGSRDSVRVPPRGRRSW